ncbi:class I SAM-dependent methyltransferase [Staphylococcus durrellii]|uniref:class I SAM-dependent methyltransferase n=1 Tax=Staphylococcus durrellii TaxID=2781773 RepID=UPI00189ECFA7|nr:methyltransferase domain-containing protein [Staphylococcus durrellii]MBF7015994.1 methyltransferase domain-containing protein [Staphylococcus durrellii]
MRHQGRNDFTLRLLEAVNIQEGMRVLDVGCATGEVTHLLSEIVGVSGEVIGVDMNEQLLDIAKANNNADNIEYINSDVYQLPDELEPFDVIVGRRILMYLPEAKACLQNLKRFLKPGGILCFQESDAINGGAGAHQLPLHQQAIQRIWDTVAAEGGDIHIGQKLYMMYLNIGIPQPQVIAEALIQTSDDNDLQWLTEMMETRMKQNEIVNQDFSLETFKANMSHEAQEAQAAFIRDMAFGVWGRKE